MDYKTYEVHFVEIGDGKTHTTMFSGTKTPHEVVDFFGLNGSDIIEYKIFEVNDDGTKTRLI